MFEPFSNVMPKKYMKMYSENRQAFVYVGTLNRGKKIAKLWQGQAENGEAALNPVIKWFEA